MLLFNTKSAKATGVPQPVTEILIRMVKDLEDTRGKYAGYSYVRTMRNILVGKEDAAIAPYFKGKPYYGLMDELKLEDMERIMDVLVQTGQLDIIYTDNGKLYCTHDYHEKKAKMGRL